MGISEKIQKNVEKQIAKKIVKKALWDAVSHAGNTDEEALEEKSMEELQEELESAGLDYWELREKSLEERIEIISTVGLDYDNYEELFSDCCDEKTEDELKEELENEGLTYDGLCRMNYEKRKEVIAAVGLDYDDYEELFEEYDDVGDFDSNTYSYNYDDVNSNTCNYEYDSLELEDSVEKKSLVAIKSFFKRNPKVVIISVLVIFLISVLAITINYVKKLIPVGYNENELVGEYWEDVVENLEDEGFTKIRSKAIFDLEYDEIDKEGEVFEVSIDGETNFTQEKRIPYDTRITVKYHTLKLLVLPFSYKEARKLDYLEADSKLKEAGFVNVKLVPIKDLVFGWLTKDGEIDKITVDGLEKYTTEDKYRPDVEIEIHYHTFKDK